MKKGNNGDNSMRFWLHRKKFNLWKDFELGLAIEGKMQGRRILDEFLNFDW